MTFYFFSSITKIIIIIYLFILIDLILIHFNFAKTNFQQGHHLQMFSFKQE